MFPLSCRIHMNRVFGAGRSLLYRENMKYDYSSSWFGIQYSYSINNNNHNGNNDNRRYLAELSFNDEHIKMVNSKLQHVEIVYCAYWKGAHASLACSKNPYNVSQWLYDTLLL